ncbi:MAG TPA: hypothetical protein VJS20_05375 [Gemmatimonadales bacterium]|nr:hypothetical protein [Gemmatimonadales bacterium]
MTQGRQKVIDAVAREAPSILGTIARDYEHAVGRFQASQLYHHFESLSERTLRGLPGEFKDRNLVGTADAICDRIRQYQEVGATTRPAITFVAESVAELKEQIDHFGREVLPEFT